MGEWPKTPMIRELTSTLVVAWAMSVSPGNSSLRPKSARQTTSNPACSWATAVATT